jgi:hypothetical protein
MRGTKYYKVPNLTQSKKYDNRTSEKTIGSKNQLVIRSETKEGGQHADQQRNLRRSISSKRQMQHVTRAPNQREAAFHKGAQP